MAKIDDLYVAIGAQFDNAGFAKAEGAISAIGGVADQASTRAGSAMQSLAATVAATSGRYVDSSGKMREANGRFVSSATLAAEAAKEFGGAAATASNGFEKFASAGAALQGAGSALSIGLTAPILATGLAAISAAGDMQALEKGFAATYKGAEPLEDALARVQELSKLPGLGLKEALQGATNLQAAGFSANLAARSLGAFGNALATVGRGKADLEGVQLALGQIASKGKISAEEIGQLAERVPQIRGAMQAAFGTSDTEALQKMGISATEFVEQVTTELEKLPKVTGGINNSFENLSDSISKAAATVGSRLNTLFDIEGTIGRAGDFIDGLADRFEALPAAAQSTIFALAGLAAAVGPLLVGLGSLGVAIPALVTGLGTIGAAVGLAAGPVALIAVGIAAAAVAIVSNWDTIVGYFTTGPGGKVFGDLADSVGRAVDAILQAFDQLGGGSDTFADLISAGGVVTQVIEDLGRGVTAVVDTITAAINSVTALFRGDFITSINEAGNVLEGLTRPMRRLLGLTSEEGPTISEFFDIPGVSRQLDELAGQGAVVGGDIAGSMGRAGEATSKLNGLLQTLQDRLKAAKETQAGAADEKTLAATNRTIESLERQIKRLQELGVGSQQAAKALASLQESLRNNERLSIALGDAYDFVGGKGRVLQSGIDSLVKAGIDPASAAVQGYVRELNNLAVATENVATRQAAGVVDFKPVVAAEVKVNPLDNQFTQDIQQQLARLGVRVPALDLSEFNASADQLKAVAAGLTALPDAGGLDTSRPINSLAELRAALTTLTGVSIGLPSLNTNNLSDSVNVATLVLDSLPAKVSAMELPPLPPLPAFDTTALTSSVDTSISELQRLYTAQLAAEQFTEGLNNALVNGIAEIAVGFGEGIGNILAGAGGLSDLGSIVLGALGGLAIQVGQLAIGVGLAVAGIKAALETLNPVVAIAGGIALVALGTAVKGIAKGIGSGGGSSGGSSLGRGSGSAVPTAPKSTFQNPTPPPARQDPAKQNNTQIIRLEVDGREITKAIKLSTDRFGRIIGQG